MYLCRNEELLDKYTEHKFNYEKNKVTPRPKILLKHYNKNNIIASRYWYGLNIDKVVITVQKY